MNNTTCQHRLAVLAASLVLATPGMAAKLTDADVGDADSFGKRVVWIGLVSTGTVTLTSSCAPLPGDPPPGPNDRCIEVLPNGTLTTQSYVDLGHITLPGNSAQTLICHSATPLIAYTFANPSATNQQGQFVVRSTYRIESSALNSAVDPDGTPLNGVLDITSLPAYRDTHTLVPGASELHQVQPTRTCIEGIVSRSTLMTSYGLTDAQAKAFFANPVTIRAGVSIQARNVSNAGVTVGTRFTADDK